jgi:hypothetical protein
MADARGDHDGVAGGDLDDGASRATELHARGACGDAEHFVRRGMIVMERIDAVDPGVAPAVGCEQVLDTLRIVWDGCTIEGQRQARIVGDGAVVAQQVLLDMGSRLGVCHGAAPVGCGRV